MLLLTGLNPRQSCQGSTLKPKDHPGWPQKPWKRQPPPPQGATKISDAFGARWGAPSSYPSLHPNLPAGIPCFVVSREQTLLKGLSYGSIFEVFQDFELT